MIVYKTILFDLDGTLLYTVEDLAAAVNHALTAYGYPTHSIPEIQRMVGNGVGSLVARALPRELAPLPGEAAPRPGGYDTPDYDAVLAEFRRFYSIHCLEHTRPYEGIPEMLSALKGKGRRCAIVTNKYQSAAEDLCGRFFPDTIDAVAGDMPGRGRKPAPDGINAALSALGRDKFDALYVGDTELDMETAENAGLPCVSVSWGYRSKAELTAQGATVIADHPQELLKILTGGG